MNDEIKAIINDFEREKRLRHPNESWSLEVVNEVFDRVMYKASVDLSPEEYELFLRHILFGTKPPNTT